ncbi:phosphoribosylamine/glycine ligase [Dethiosulfovibrio peptidovorans DSM 11002]|uniref:Phosphoribosylamine--glycine ligase n=1 Tax=Dethiosulfovibrio peptidovorans DSM 11002 TaxID=469381 RepID=D2Z4P5_9BACT|nr:phosphoribosylamine--glycine ligase [Dethiosulfovibrio peptidovorans]EFC92389.1 phosphoribosylamine/glycine ligase [Dethiosulfovibrio peptidovorans DSM 11002]
MKVLVLGGGGREHAIAWALAKSPLCDELHALPGNPGIAGIATCHEGDPCDGKSVVKLAEDLSINLVVVGPEAPLVSGVSDELRRAGIPVFGPGKAGAMLEASKAYSKEFMARHGIPTAPFKICRSMDEAREALEERKPPYIVKADGLAAGKGVFISDDLSQALDSCEELLDGSLDEAGKTLVVENGLTGREVSVMIITDGETWRLLHTSQDHKRAFDGDRGPNTGGMGAYAPVPWVDPEMTKKIEQEIVEKTLSGLKKDDIDYRGVIYAGLMVSPEGRIDLLEYNVRLGDPETQALLPLFDGDWLEACLRCAQGKLSEAKWSLKDLYSVNLVIASEGYPGSYEKGYPIEGLDDEEEGVTVFQAGTALKNGKTVTAGGRVLSVVGTGDSHDEARKRAYGKAEKIKFQGAFYRKDIAANTERPREEDR